jgi:uroporphyrinogen decarboxylase
MREKASLLQLFRDPERAAQITALPIEDLGVDAAILFSDILVVADALGLGLDFIEGTGPRFKKAIASPSDICALPSVSASTSLAYVFEAIAKIKQRVSCPLIGFAGAPFTVAAYMVEGASASDCKAVRRWLYSAPQAFEELMEKVCVLTIEYLQLQVAAGVDAIQLFESWGHLLTPTHYQKWSAHYLKKIVDALRPLQVPVILFSRGAGLNFEALVGARPSAISLDWPCDLPLFRQKTKLPLQGNLDPCALFAPKEQLAREVDTLLASMGKDPGYIFNLGHGILPDTPFENVRFLVEQVRRFH